MERLSRALNKETETFSRALEMVSSGWEGENAACWLEKGKSGREALRNCAKILGKAAGRIRRIARRTYDAEMEALERARRDEA